MFLRIELIRKTATNSGTHFTMGDSFKYSRKMTLLDIHQPGREHEQKTFVTPNFRDTAKGVTKFG